MQKAVEDLNAVMEATQAGFVFGHSAGGLIALETALLFPVKKLAVYETPISIAHSLPSDWLGNFEKAIEKKQFKKAMAISLKGLRVMEGIEKMPFWVVLLLINVISILERKKEKGTKMLELLPTLIPDMKMAMLLDSKQERYSAISIPALLMQGSKSPAYFHEGTKALNVCISQSTLKTMEGFDHYSPEEKVDELAKELISFFK
ncbi:MAG: alpha/beta hydrolase [Bacteroidetes bacterium]|nr:alpha/beta hydrolase [Bacteroidota bacterium]